MAGKRGDRACRPADPELDRLLRTRFRCGRADEQTDLFLDTAPARASQRPTVDSLGLSEYIPGH
ncbi:MAG: hypothetical protein OXI10_05270, partial [Gammaproteobacteria bacterium]|nr:hypothetical protein [Gammaproteobacteria bacterium]